MTPRRQLSPPKAVVEVARATMGSIDLDPYSTEEANRLVQAARYLDRDDDPEIVTGRHWSPAGSKRLFLGIHSNIGITRALLEKALAEYRGGHVNEAILWFNANEALTHCPWLWDFPICLPFRRLAPCFWDDELEKYIRVQPATWSAIAYLPVASPAELFARSVARFHAAAGALGRVVMDQWSGEGLWEAAYRAGPGRKRKPPVT